MRRLALVFWAATLAWGQAPAIESIREEALKADLYFLASDAMRGRLTATPEYTIAARWIQSRFERLGLKPVSGSSYTQDFTMTVAHLDEGNHLAAPAGQITRVGRLGEDFFPLIFSASVDVQAPVAFAGYGIRAPELGWDDLRHKTVQGRIALILTGEPGTDDPASPFDGLVTSEHATSLRKALNAQEHGALGILFVDPKSREGGAERFPGNARAYWPEQPPRIQRYTLTSMGARLRIPAAEISPAFAEYLLSRGAGSPDLPSAVAAAEKGEGNAELSPFEVELRTRLRRDTITDENLVAMIEGADEALKSEAVLISAHYDHNGADDTQTFNGADDNGSGTVALLAIAEAYTEAARRGQRPRRSVIFAVWGSEERCCGPLLGSWAWTEHPLWPLEKTVATLNMDMIGRSEEVPVEGGRRFRGLQPQTAESNAGAVNILGYSFSPELAEAARSANREIDLTLRFRYDNNRSNLLRRSDQWPFLQRGVPALFFHTGLHPDYHTSGDRPERIDYAKMKRIAGLVYQLSWDLANQDGRPRMASPRKMPEPD
jgi:hypothetical protein